MMGIRLLELHRLLKPTGSLYLHCDPTASHYLKLSLDAVFGKAAFRNEIVWRKYAGRKNNAKTKFSTQHDSIFFYAKSAMAKFNGVMLPHTEKEIAAKYKHRDKEGRRYRLSWGRHYQLTGKNRKIYLDESPGRAIGNLWVEEGLQLNTSSREREYWATQKPLALLQRIIRASSNPGDVVLDPFAGCATACVAAEMEGRQWIGIEEEKNAIKIIRKRLDQADLGALGGQANARRKVAIKDKPPRRTDPEGVAIAKKRKTGVAVAKRKTRAYATKENFNFLYGTQRGICNLCGDWGPWERFSFDHITPQEHGGSDELDNLQLLCTHCNSTKGTGTMADARKRRQKQREKYGLPSL